MRRSKVDITLHFVWATWHREPLVREDIERALYRTIEAESERLGCAVGRELCGESQAFGWQDHYGVLSVSHAHLPQLIRYVRGQKAHRESGKLWAAAEVADEEDRGDRRMPCR